MTVKLESLVFWLQHVVWWMDTSISEGQAAYIFKFFRGVNIDFSH